MVVQYKLNCPVGMLHSISQRNISLQSTHTYIHARFKNILPLPALVHHCINFRFALIRKCFAPIHGFVSLMIKLHRPNETITLAKKDFHIFFFFFTRSGNVACANRRRVRIIERNSKDRKRTVTSDEKEQRILRRRKMGDPLGTCEGRRREERGEWCGISSTMKLDPDTVL